MSITARAIIAGSLFLLMVLSGLWVSRTGRPLNVGISTVHKLISLGLGVFLVVIVLQLNRMTPLTAAEWGAVVVTALLFLGNAATGGFLSSDKPLPRVVLRMHQIFPVLAALSTAATLYLLLGRT